MNNLDFKMKSIYHRNPETTLMLNGIYIILDSTCTRENNKSIKIKSNASKYIYT